LLRLGHALSVEVALLFVELFVGGLWREAVLDALDSLIVVKSHFEDSENEHERHRYNQESPDHGENPFSVLACAYSCLAGASESKPEAKDNLLLCQLANRL
jgi:hypothetical protein